ncbi:16S rRNA (guanine(527)-N(7))-methyltransferase RsmG [Desulfovibrio sp. OttesenSCG-928-O18]|nr:16S rRNA (guanine(527)-N(7))-methyltransferase RsmG [Desulfovibrio sp. OttesenSCG-928-O18]
MRNVSVIPADVLARRLESLGFSPAETVITDLAVYLGLLIKWNKAMNLVGTSSWEETLETLVVDSFHLAAFLPGAGLPASPVCFDLGAGAGLPGIPLRMLWREGTYTLVEAREKRALFMRTALAGLDLGDTRVFHGRAEEFFRTAVPADLVVSRAFMPWQSMLAFVEDALAPDARVVFLTLSPAPEELPQAWECVAQTTYAVKRTTRYFWCFNFTGKST